MTPGAAMMTTVLPLLQRCATKIELHHLFLVKMPPRRGIFNL